MPVDEPHQPVASSDSLAESTPLLPRPTDHHHVPEGVHQKSKILWTVLFANLLASSSGGFLAIPTTRLIEDVLCREYYSELNIHLDRGAPIDEGLCKTESIQSSLSFILAIQSAAIATVSLLAAFPWSLAADRIGRKPVLAWCLTGMALGAACTITVLWFRDVFPVKLIWLEAVAQLVGGGNPVAIGMLLSIIADATNEEERAVVFMRQYVVSACGNLLSPTVSSFIMARVGPWPPAFIGLGLIISSILAIAFVPETLPAKQATLGEVEDEYGDVSKSSSQLSHLLDRFRQALSILSSPSLVILLIACLGAVPVAHSTYSFMAVFLSKRYSIPLFRAGYIQSAFGLAQVVQTILILPWLSQCLLLRGRAGNTEASTTTRLLAPASEHHRDLSIARASAAILALAALILGLAPTLSGFVFGLAVLAMGSGCASLLRSLMSIYVDPAHRSRLFGLVGMVEMVGQIYAQPMLAGLFSLGMRLGSGWIGLPYFGLTILLTVMATLLLFVRVPKRTGETMS